MEATTRINSFKRFIKKDYQPYVSLGTYRFGLIVTAAVFIVFGLIDFLIIDNYEVLMNTFIVKFLFVIPIYIISLWLTYQPSFEQRQPLISFLLGTFSLIALLIMLFLAKQSRHEYYDLYFTAFVVALSFAPLVLWYNKIFIFLSLPIGIILFNITSIFATSGDINITQLSLQNMLILTGGIIGSYCRYFVINILRWSIQKTGIITERRQLLEIAHKKLERSDNIKRLLLSILSHDIKEPINNTGVLLQLLSKDIITPQEFNTQSKNLNDQLIHAKEILDNVLLWSKSEMNVVDDGKLMSLHNLVSENIINSKVAAKEKAIVLHNNIDPDAVYHGDLNIVRLILRNLLTNAIKFTEDGNIIISSHQKDNQLTLSVKDDGIGMDKSEVERLFNPEKHFSKGGTRSEKGTGLGLTICQEVVKRYGGKLFVETEKGKGTTFHFTLPSVLNEQEYASHFDGGHESKMVFDGAA